MGEEGERGNVGARNNRTSICLYNDLSEGVRIM